MDKIPANECAVIHITALEKRIKELEIIEKQESMNASLLVREEIETLKRVLSQSTPLIPEIEKTFDAGQRHNLFPFTCENKQDYISNLKLDI